MPRGSRVFPYLTFINDICPGATQMLCVFNQYPSRIDLDRPYAWTKYLTEPGIGSHRVWEFLPDPLFPLLIFKLPQPIDSTSSWLNQSRGRSCDAACGQAGGGASSWAAEEEMAPPPFVSTSAHCHRPLAGVQRPWVRDLRGVPRPSPILVPAPPPTTSRAAPPPPPIAHLQASSHCTWPPPMLRVRPRRRPPPGRLHAVPWSPRRPGQPSPVEIDLVAFAVDQTLRRWDGRVSPLAASWFSAAARGSTSPGWTRFTTAWPPSSLPPPGVQRRRDGRVSPPPGFLVLRRHPGSHVIGIAAAQVLHLAGRWRASTVRLCSRSVFFLTLDPCTDMFWQ
jgi:hypothetical protein